VLCNHKGVFVDLFVVTLTAELFCGVTADHLLQNTCIAAALHNNAGPYTANWICVWLHCCG
jgi:hypothetical protein